MNMGTDYLKLAEDVVKSAIEIIKKPCNELDKPLIELGYDSLDIVDLTLKIEDGMREIGYALFAVPIDEDFTDSTIQEIIGYVAEGAKKSEKSGSN